ncbi:hypothetical protein LOCC1_G008766 [Lachnellula occidentalis]|uniref:DUF6604 domain-containing protein n=1 Tax=Lachnellula occidentalis TaxID=215460 RepID=A0A8H8RQ16_9HELO|nr:hypothetical protein LOCC1_G008766 [Lachnellula occidentalis]
MLPSSLTGTYERYKDDTSTFLRWLLENAPKSRATKDKDGSAPAATPSPAPSKTARLKGKARLDAKKAVSAPPTNSYDSQEYCIVSLKELMPLATSIVNCDKPFITVPTHVFRAGLRAVSARKRCTSHFKRTTEDKETEESNQRHSYFSSLMEDVLRILQPRFLATRQRQTDHTEPGSTEKIPSFETIENRFAALELEDTEELETASTFSPERAARVYEVERSRDKKVLEEEKMFSIFCLLQDFWQLRDYVTTLWSDYKDRKIDVITASVTTNAAFMLAIRTQDEALAAYPELCDTQDIITALKSYTPCDETGDETTWASSPRDGVNLEDWAFGAEYDILGSFCHSEAPNEIPPKRGYDGLHIPFPDGSTMSHEDQRLQNMNLLHDILPEFGLFGFISKVHLYAQDELTRGICLMIHNGFIPIWLPMATKCYLDICLLLQDKVGDAFSDGREIQDHAKSTIDRYLEFSDGLNTKVDFETQTKIIKKWAFGFGRFMFSDSTFRIKVSLHEKFGLPPPHVSERYYLFLRQPILCGLIAYRIALVFRSLGLALNRRWGTITYPAHLYNALRKKTNPISVWPLMEEAINQHGGDNLFVGGRPNTISDCFKHIELATGGSVSNLAKNRRNIRKVHARRGTRRRLIDTYTLGTIFEENFQQGKAGIDEMDKDKEFLHRRVKEYLDPEVTQQPSIYRVEKSLNSQVKEAALAANPTSKSLRCEWQTKCLTSLQLLEALRESMLAEMPKLEFKYFHMYEHSIKMLKILGDELDADFVKLLGPGYLESDGHLQHIAYWILSIAFHCDELVSLTGSAVSNGKSKMIRRDLTVGSHLLDKVGRVVEKFLGEQAAEEQALEEQAAEEQAAEEQAAEEQTPNA